MKSVTGEYAFEIFSLKDRRAYAVRNITIRMHETNPGAIIVKNGSKTEVYETEFAQLIRETCAAFKDKMGCPTDVPAAPEKPNKH